MKPLLLAVFLLTGVQAAYAMLGDSASPVSPATLPPTCQVGLTCEVVNDRVVAGPFSLITQTYAGRITITSGLTKEACQARADDAMGQQNFTADQQAVVDRWRRMQAPSRKDQTGNGNDLYRVGAPYEHVSTDILSADCVE